jgi:hypothetical protein
MPQQSSALVRGNSWPHITVYGGIKFALLRSGRSADTTPLAKIQEFV